MSDDIVDRLLVARLVRRDHNRLDDMAYNSGRDWELKRQAADEIERLRARVTELEAENRKLGEFGAVDHAQWKGERALADQLAEALREVSEVTKVLHGRGDLADCLIQSFTALAAHEAARRKTP